MLLQNVWTNDRPNQPKAKAEIESSRNTHTQTLTHGQWKREREKERERGLTKCGANIHWHETIYIFSTKAKFSEANRTIFVVFQWIVMLRFYYILYSLSVYLCSFFFAWTIVNTRPNWFGQLVCMCWVPRSISYVQWVSLHRMNEFGWQVSKCIISFTFHMRYTFVLWFHIFYVFVCVFAFFFVFVVAFALVLGSLRAWRCYLNVSLERVHRPYAQEQQQQLQNRHQTRQSNLLCWITFGGWHCSKCANTKRVLVNDTTE